jgi:hypothetical protein
VSSGCEKKELGLDSNTAANDLIHHDSFLTLGVITLLQLPRIEPVFPEKLLSGLVADLRG